MIFITHKLNEVIEVADKIVVLRRGRVAGTADPKTTTRQELANLMVGRDVELIVPKGPAKPGDVVLRINDLYVRDTRLEMAVKGLDLEVRAGEIVVIAGVQGNGQTELVEAITGLRAPRLGPDRDRDPRRRQVVAARGLGPRRRPHPGGPWPRRADRLHDRGRELHPGHVPPRAVQPARACSTSRPSTTGRRRASRTSTSGRRPSTPSPRPCPGGNQQKVVVAREFSVPVQLVIAAQPTRGLDVGSIEYIHRRIVEQRDAGAAIVIVSTELDEVLAVGDRIAVMFDGRIVGILEGADATYENLGLLMGGAVFGEGAAA